MRSIFIKELRENAIWATLLALALGVALSLALTANIESFAGITVTMTTMFGFSATGLGFGLLTIFQDQRRGRWAFLTHRPISRSNIFWAKVLAGITLHLLTTGIPFLIVVLWVATPGHKAWPFDWRMTIPGIIDMLSGIVWFFAAMLVATRQARWLGSRLMPLGIAFVAVFIAGVFSTQFWHTLVPLTIATLVLLPAARGSFIAGGNDEPQPRMARLSQMIGIGVGLCLCVFGAVGILEGILQWLFEKTPSTYVSYRYIVDRTGQPVRLTVGNGTYLAATDPSGKPLPPEFMQHFDVKNPYTTTINSRSILLVRREDFLSGEAALRNPAQYALRLPDGPGDDVHWFYIVGRKTIEGYDTRSKRLIGSIGPDGFAPESQPPHAFVAAHQYSELAVWNLIVDGNNVYAFDLREGNRTIRRVLTTSNNDPILAAVTTYLQPDPQHGQDNARRHFIVATQSTIHVIDFFSGNELFRLPLEHQMPPYSQLVIGEPVQGNAAWIFWYNADIYNTQDIVKKTPQILVKVDTTGQVLGREELPPLPPDEVDGPQWYGIVPTALVPPVLLAAAMLHKEFNLASGEGISLILLMCLVAIASAAGTYALARRHAWPKPRLIGWTLLNFLTGVPGILLLLSLNDWPARVPCPSCAKRRVVTRDTCEHCAATIPAPAIQGIEIFE